MFQPLGSVPFNATIVNYMDTKYGQGNWHVLQSVYNFKVSDSIVAYATYGAGQVPTEDLIIVSVEVIGRIKFVSFGTLHHFLSCRYTSRSDCSLITSLSTLRTFQ